MTTAGSAAVRAAAAASRDRRSREARRRAAPPRTALLERSPGRPRRSRRSRPRSPRRAGRPEQALRTPGSSSTTRIRLRHRPVLAIPRSRGRPRAHASSGRQLDHEARPLRRVVLDADVPVVVATRRGCTIARPRPVPRFLVEKYGTNSSSGPRARCPGPCPRPRGAASSSCRAARPHGDRAAALHRRDRVVDQVDQRAPHLLGSRRTRRRGPRRLDEPAISGWPRVQGERRSTTATDSTGAGTTLGHAREPAELVDQPLERRCTSLDDRAHVLSSDPARSGARSRNFLRGAGGELDRRQRVLDLVGDAPRRPRARPRCAGRG